MSTTEALTSRWTELRHHPEHERLFYSPKRFRVAAAGRRSGKTELAKRYLVKQAISDLRGVGGRYLAAAPTRDQAREIFWDDLKALVPDWMKRGEPNETRLEIFLLNGTTIKVIGLDKAYRAEGKPIDGIIIDEYAQCKPTVWGQNIRPALSTLGREGWAWIIGVPRGAKHFVDIFRKAKSDSEEWADWDAFEWKSADILTASEIAEARATLDPLEFAQEYEASLRNVRGRAYYTFEEKDHAGFELHYDARRPLDLSFDFNVDPGVATVSQRQSKEWYREKHQIELPEQLAPVFTAFIGEVWIPVDSNTARVCRRIASDWSHHKGDIHYYGDATGGRRQTSSQGATDWTEVRDELSQHFKSENLKNRVESSNPPEKDRVIAVRRHLKRASGEINMLVCPHACPHLIDDFENVVVAEGTAGEIRKDPKSPYTHISDAAGYMIAAEFPAHEVESSFEVISY